MGALAVQLPDRQVASFQLRLNLNYLHFLTVRMGKKKSSAKKKAQKAASNVFSLFTQTQIQEFKEAFNMIDQKQRWLHQSGGSWWYVRIDGKGPPSGLLGSHDQRSVS